MEERATKKRKVRRKRKKWPIIFLLSVAAIIAIALSPICEIRTVTITGNKEVTQEEILAAAGSLEGKNIFRIGIGKIEENIEKIPYVKQAKINRLLPDKLSITITETNVGMYLPYNGKMVGVDEEGNVIELIAPDYAIHAPVVEGVTVTACEVGGTVSVEEDAAFQLAATYIGYFKEYEMFSKVTLLDVSNVEDVQFTLNYKLRVEFGNDEQVSYKMKYLEQVINEVGEHSEGRINIRSIDHVVYKEGPEATEVPEDAALPTELPSEEPTGEEEDSAE